MRLLVIAIAFALLILCRDGTCAQQSHPTSSAKEKIIIDTDIGTDIDDAFAVALALRSPEFQILGIATDFGDTEGRAKILDRMLGEAGRQDIPVAVGITTAIPANYGDNLPQRRYGQGGHFARTQLAVFLDAQGLDDASMQRIARELNLPEVTFVLPSSLAGCVADVRIFTPLKEMVFAGHPTIGTASVLRDKGAVPPSLTDFQLQEKVGPVPVRVADDGSEIIRLRTPKIEWERAFEPTLCADVLGLPAGDLVGNGVAPQLLSAGNPTLFVPLRNQESVDRSWLTPDGMKVLRGDEPEPFCVFPFAARPEGAYSRMFAPDYGIPEDAATGSATGPLAAFMTKHRLTSASRFVSEQGTKMGRRSLLHVHIQEAGDIDVGGHVTPVGEGTIRFRRTR
jgi:trans-2,3-dihydro-3-hydroxyanthranilate isomerase